MWYLRTKVNQHVNQHMNQQTQISPGNSPKHLTLKISK